jgi:hypothetical protein
MVLLVVTVIGTSDITFMLIPCQSHAYLFNHTNNIIIALEGVKEMKKKYVEI